MLAGHCPQHLPIVFSWNSLHKTFFLPHWIFVGKTRLRQALQLTTMLFKSVILLPPLPRSWDHQCRPPCLNHYPFLSPIRKKVPERDSNFPKATTTSESQKWNSFEILSRTERRQKLGTEGLRNSLLHPHNHCKTFLFIFILYARSVLPGRLSVHHIQKSEEGI